MNYFVIVKTTVDIKLQNNILNAILPKYYGYDYLRHNKSNKMI